MYGSLRNANLYVPNLRFPGFEGEWEEKKLGELLEFKNGINASKEQYGKGIKFVNVSDILNNDFLTYDNILGLVDIDNSTLNKYSVEYGDVLFQRSSETRDEVGTANVYLDKNNIAVFGGFVIRGKKLGNYNPIFLNNLLKSTTARNSITSRSGGSTRYNVGQDILSSVELCLPSIIEQKKIGELLSLIDQRIQTQNKIIEELNVLKANLAKRIFLGKLKFKDDSGNDFPKWKEKKLEEIIVSIGTKKFQIKISEVNDIGFYKVIDQGQELISGYSDNEKRVFTNYPTIVFGDHTTILKYIDFPFIVGADGTKLLKNKYSDNLKYLYYNLQYNNVKQEGYKRHFTILSKVFLQVPSVTEQNKIANLLSSIDSKINIETLLLQKLEVQKKFLLQNIFV